MIYKDLTVHLDENSEVSGTLFHGDHNVGSVYMEVDGYWVWEPPRTVRWGFFAPHHLRRIADKLDEMNKEWDDIVQNDPSIA